MKLIWSRWARICGMAVVAASLAGCATVPETGRRQLDFIPASQEMQLGLTSFEKLKQETKISKDPALNAMVQRVGRRVAAVAPLPGAQWEFVVFDNKEANAFCLPGGKVGVYTGIFPITRDEAGLATVIGHEVAHAVARHGAERMSRALVLQSAGNFINTSLADPKTQALFGSIYGIGTQVGLELPHSRLQESEADEIGLYYMADAGYRPEAAVGFWERFAAYIRQAGGGTTPAFLRTHPLDEVRIAHLRELLPKAQARFRPVAP